MKQITKFEAQQIRVGLNEALAQLGKKLGLSFSVGTIRFDSATAEIKVKAAVQNPDGTFEDPYVREFKKYCSLHRLTEDDLGARFVANGSVFQITGFNPRNSRYPLLAKSAQTGKIYKFPVWNIRELVDLYTIENA